jgi:hypothetical protein
MGYLKHNANGSNGKRPRTKPVKPETVPPVTVNVDMSGVEAELAAIAHSAHSYVVNSFDGEHKLAIFTGPSGSGYHPVLIALEESDTMDRVIGASERIATAFERIADSLARLTGPPLTSDGGAPGPKVGGVRVVGAKMSDPTPSPDA